MNTDMKPKKTRSPNYPTVALEKSLSQAQTLLDKYARYPIAMEVAIGVLGYTLKSSAGKQAMATLSAYGLVQIEGSGSEKKVSVSDLAFKILADKRGFSPEREAAIREAALNPSIYQKIIGKFAKSLPADDALEWELLSTFKFTKASIHDFITVFRGTLDFAKVYESGIIGDEKSLSEAPIQELPGGRPMLQPEPARSRTTMQHATLAPAPIPEGEYEIAKFFLGKDISVRLVASAPITKFTQKTIDKLIRHLELDKEDMPVDDMDKSDDE